MNDLYERKRERKRDSFILRSVSHSFVPVMAVEVSGHGGGMW